MGQSRTAPCACCSGDDRVTNVEVAFGPKSIQAAASRSAAPGPRLPPVALEKVHSEPSTRATASDEESRETRESGVKGELSELGFQAKLLEALRAGGVARLEENAKEWCSQRGITTVKQVVDVFEELRDHLGLTYGEQHRMRVVLGLPPLQAGLMKLKDVGVELAVTADEFASHYTMVCRMKTKPALKKISGYLAGNGILFTAVQAKQMFDVLLQKTTRSNDSPYSLRSQLVMALHCFCVEPYTLWEDDGCDSTLWQKMTYEGINLWNTGLCEDLARTLFTDSRRPVTEREENLRTDISGIRFALEVLRSHGNRDRPLALRQMIKPKFHGTYGDCF